MATFKQEWALIFKLAVFFLGFSFYLSGCTSLLQKTSDPILDSGLEKFNPVKYEDLQDHSFYPTEEDYNKCLDYAKRASYTFYSLTYLSASFKVKALVGLPPKFNSQEKHPLVVFNRGGNRDFGALSVCTIGLLQHFAETVPNAVIMASQYRGGAGSEGLDEFGGADVDDILNLVKWAERVSFINTQDKYVVGWSRGGMMTYLTLKKDKSFKAGVVIAGWTDLIAGEKNRPEMIDVHRELIPGYEKHRLKVLKERSAAYWPEKIETPLLIMQGSDDWRVSVKDVRRMDKLLARHKKKYKYIEFSHEGHDLDGVYPQVLQNTRDWFASHK